MPFAEVRDIAIYYQEMGQGSPILFIPGGGVDHAPWIPLAQRMRDRYRCILLDNRGVGQTDKPLQPYSVSQMAQDALGLLDHLGIAACHLVGHSMGGYIAQRTALEAPSRCQSLVLVGTATHPRPHTVYLMELRMALIRRLERRPFLEAVAAWMFSPASFGHRRELIDGFVRQGAENPNPQPEYAYDAHLTACIRFSSQDTFTSLRVPTLVLVGEDDLLTPPACSRELAEGIPGARLVTIPEAGHMVLLEQPDILAREMKAFLEAQGEKA